VASDTLTKLILRLYSSKV